MNQRHCAAHRPGPTRRSFIAGFVCTAVLPTVAVAEAAGLGSAEDERFMRMALDEAPNVGLRFVRPPRCIRI